MAGVLCEWVKLVHELSNSSQVQEQEDCQMFKELVLQKAYLSFNWIDFFENSFTISDDMKETIAKIDQNLENKSSMENFVDIEGFLKEINNLDMSVISLGEKNILAKAANVLFV
jgi:hypothetical protein